MKQSSLGKVVVAVFLLFATALPDIVIAQETPMLDSGDTAWMLTSTALVLFMTIPRPVTILRGRGPIQECAAGHDAMLCHHLPRDRSVDSSALSSSRDSK